MISMEPRIHAFSNLSGEFKRYGYLFSVEPMFTATQKRGMGTGPKGDITIATGNLNTKSAKPLLRDDDMRKRGFAGRNDHNEKYWYW